LKGNMDYFLKSFQQIQPPRILLIGISWIFAIISVLLLRDYFTPFWLAIFFMVNFGIMISIPKKFWNRKLLVAIAGIPRGFLLMFFTLLKIRGANKTFIHTAHGADKQKK